MRIRKATEDDIPAIVELHVNSWQTAYKPFLSEGFLFGPLEESKKKSWIDTFKSLGPKDFILIAEEDGEAKGFVSVYADRDQKYGHFLDNIHVLPNLKGHGLGTKLMKEVAKNLKDFKHQRLFLWVIVENISAKGFYEHYGAEAKDIQIDIIEGEELTEIRMVWDNFSKSLLG